MIETSLSKLIAPSFYSLHNNLKNNEYGEYFIKGGRGSTKSSWASIETVLALEKDPHAHALVYRDTSNNLRDTVYTQVAWAIDILGLQDEWIAGLNPLQFTKKGTKQRIIFKGASDPNKSKSIKAPFGYFKIVWFEEADSFRSMEEIRKIVISAARGSTNYSTLLTYNPPNNSHSWINKEVLIPTSNRRIHHSTYLDIPKDWLGVNFLEQAEILKESNPLEYQHTYLGDVVGTGRQVFSNIEIRNFRVDEILNFDRIYNGIDWGFFPDPFVLIRCHYDRKRRELYIFEEFTVNKETNESLIRYVKQRLPVGQSIIADCASPKDILDFQNSGISIEGSIKGKDSVKYGIDFLKDLNKIIIDPVRCPLATEEFSLYELILDRTGEVVLQYPDKNNHTIDAIRYALQWVMPQRGGLQILSSTKTYNDVLNTYSTKMLVSGADKNFGTVTTNAYRSVFDD